MDHIGLYYSDYRLLVITSQKNGIAILILNTVKRYTRHIYAKGGYGCAGVYSNRLRNETGATSLPEKNAKRTFEKILRYYQIGKIVLRS
ncbi:uncharacterized protein isoform X1 [Rhodnius prolixus]|uniref:uncharacterized protein isoform X1 n=1 Tax=Rhodnius prolixus TaxID=13249 RepID=UPI003D1889C7